MVSNFTADLTLTCTTDGWKGQDNLCKGEHILQFSQHSKFALYFVFPLHALQATFLISSILGGIGRNQNFQFSSQTIYDQKFQNFVNY